jgi:hypothetical protein
MRFSANFLCWVAFIGAYLSAIPVSLSFVFCMADNLPSLSKPELIVLVKDLREENGRLERKVSWLKRLIRNSTGENAELSIAELLNAMHSEKNDAHDMTVRDGKLLEVKGSLCNHFNVKKGDYWRWTWHNFLGSGGNKTYDRLILVGEADKKYIETYRDKKAPFVIFDVPFKWASDVAREKKTVKFAFHLQTKLSGAKSARCREIWKFEVTREELISRYKVK